MSLIEDRLDNSSGIDSGPELDEEQSLLAAPSDSNDVRVSGRDTLSTGFRKEGPALSLVCFSEQFFPRCVPSLHAVCASPWREICDSNLAFSTCDWAKKLLSSPCSVCLLAKIGAPCLARCYYKIGLVLQI